MNMSGVMSLLKISIFVRESEQADIIGMKEDFAAYCEKFGDVAFVDVKKVQPKPKEYKQERMF